MISVHVDVDNLWVYEQEYGVSFGQPPGFLFDRTMPRLLEALARHETRATFFIVGKDLEIASAQQFYREAVRRGHVIGNHTYTHPTHWSTMTAAEKRGEIQQCHDAIRSVTGQRPIGFRAPGYYIDQDIINVLVELGYSYDSSVLPGYANHIMRAYARMRGVGARAKTFGRAQYLFASRHPRRFSGTQGQGTILELPISVAPFLRSPSHTTFLYVLGRPYRSIVKLFYRLAPHGHVYLFHAIDFIDLPSAERLAGQIIPLRWSFLDRSALVDEMLRFFTQLNNAPIITTESQLHQFQGQHLPLMRL